MNAVADARFWDRAVRRVSRRIHSGWWLDGWLAALIPTSLLAALVVLVVRWRWESAMRWMPWTLGGLLLVTMAVAWWRMRRQAEPMEATRVRLEDALGLHAALSAAQAGAAPWPEAREPLPMPVVFRPQRPLAMALVGLLLVGAAWWVPVSRYVPPELRTIEKPAALREVEQWIDQVKEEDAVAEESAEEVEKEMQELLQRPATDWYEHAALEAADQLREMTAQDLEQLSQNLAAAEQASSALAQGHGLPNGLKESLAQKLADASRQLQNGGMKPSQDLTNALRQLDPSSLKGMSQQELQKLSDQLKKNSKALQEALKNSPNLKLCDCAGDKPGKGKAYGQGGPTRGPGEVPLSMEEDVTDLGTQRKEKLDGQLDLQRLAAADTVQVTDAAPQVDAAADHSPQAGGALRSAGDGGSSAWQDELVPTEREILKRYFR
ncbi:MAG: hypothetical protein KDK99_07545 [Verrucomicrobiales bacterium]|nr:hypothetical protein [Verrucomicrobiales bacterium]